MHFICVQEIVTALVRSEAHLDAAGVTCVHIVEH